MFASGICAPVSSDTTNSTTARFSVESAVPDREDSPGPNLLAMEDEPTLPVCYVTTRGRVSHREHTIEIWYVEYADCIYLLSGYGDRADWVKNLRASPEVTVAIAPDGPQ